jgi:histidyl-tRNA synthetase
VERVVELMLAEGVIPADEPPVAYFVLAGDKARHEGFSLAERLRDDVPGLRMTFDCSGGGIKAQLKRADRSGARYAFILGDDELEAGEISLKPLRDGSPQEAVGLDELASRLLRDGVG